MIKDSRRQLLYFLLVGSTGFVIDGGVLTILTAASSINIYSARLVSFSVATFATWWLNRRYTFSIKSSAGAMTKSREYGRYFLVQTGGALLNLSIFAWLIFVYPPLRDVPILPLAVGAVAGLVWNFLGARLWVYKA